MKDPCGNRCSDRQSFSYNDTLLFLAIMFVMMLPLLLLLRKPKPGKGPAMMH